MSGRRGIVCCLLLAMVVAWGQHARAEAPGDRATARKLGGEALDLYKAKDFGAALSKFELADRLTPAPTLKLHAARCLEKLGRLRDAVARYREAIAIELMPHAPKVHVEAREDAVRELALLLESAPRIVLVVTGAGRSGVRTSIDGASIGEAVGEVIVLDPGAHVVQVSGGGLRVSRTVTASRGRTTKVEIDLSEDGADVMEDPGGRRSAGAGLTVQGRRSLRAAGWSLAGVGAAGLAVGAVGTVLLFQDRARLESVCPGSRCAGTDPDAVELANRFNRERWISSAGWIGGGVFAAAGASLLLTAGLSRGRVATTWEEGRTRHRDSITATWTPVVGPSFIGMGGRF